MAALVTRSAEKYLVTNIFKLFAVFQATDFSETDDIRSCPPRLVIMEHEADDLGAFLIANDMILVTTGKTICS